MLENSSLYITIDNSELERIKAGVVIPGSRILLWILQKIAPGKII